MVKGLEGFPNETFTRAFLVNLVAKIFLGKYLEAIRGKSFCIEFCTYVQVINRKQWTEFCINRESVSKAVNTK